MQLYLLRDHLSVCSFTFYVTMFTFGQCDHVLVVLLYNIGHGEDGSDHKVVGETVHVSTRAGDTHEAQLPQPLHIVVDASILGLALTPSHRRVQDKHCIARQHLL